MIEDNPLIIKLPGIPSSTIMINDGGKQIRNSPPLQSFKLGISNVIKPRKIKTK
jgi:hypothetical protein